MKRYTKKLQGQIDRMKVKLSRLPLTELFVMWEMTEGMNEDETPEVRGFIQDELENRNQEGFEAWIESYEGSPEPFFVSRGVTA